MTRAVYLCGGADGTASKRDAACPDPVHDWPLPTGYVDASVEADWRAAEPVVERALPRVWPVRVDARQDRRPARTTAIVSTRPPDPFDVRRNFTVVVLARADDHGVTVEVQAWRCRECRALFEIDEEQGRDHLGWHVGLMNALRRAASNGGGPPT